MKREKNAGALPAKEQAPTSEASNATKSITETPCDARERYIHRLRSLPPSGGGGCHQALLGAANLGALLGLSAEQIVEDLRRHVHGTRRVPDRELREAALKACRESRCLVLPDGSPYRPYRPVRREPLLHDGRGIQRQLIEQGKHIGRRELLALSPHPLPESPRLHAALVFRHLFEPGDLVFSGGRRSPGILGSTIKPAQRWLGRVTRGAPPPEHLILNPLSGRCEPSKDGHKRTRRGDNCAAAYRFAVAEFDQIPEQEQIAFWAASGISLVALVDSGGKSVHAWIDLRPDRIGSAAEWEHTVGAALYRDLLVPCGVDPACRHPARLTRLPGHFRGETSRWQRLLWFCPTGRSVLDE